MKIVSWNCCNGFDKPKQSTFFSNLNCGLEDVDVFVVQECRREEIFALRAEGWTSVNWHGDDLDDNSDLGVGVFSKKYEIDFTEEFNRNFRYVVPYVVSHDKIKKLTLLAVWTKSADRGKYYYDRNVVKAVEYYNEKKLIDDCSIIIGDFNTFAKNDAEIMTLEENLKGFCNCAKNSRLKHTYCHTETNTGIDDFCFASSKCADMVTVEVLGLDNKSEYGKRQWMNISDHCPIVADIRANSIIK